MIAMQIVPPAGQAAPVLVCDGCGDVIDDTMFAGILWLDRLEQIEAVFERESLEFLAALAPQIRSARPPPGGGPGVGAE
mgnify:FL=1